MNFCFGNTTSLSNGLLESDSMNLELLEKCLEFMRRASIWEASDLTHLCANQDRNFCFHDVFPSETGRQGFHGQIVTHGDLS